MKKLIFSTILLTILFYGELTAGNLPEKLDFVIPEPNSELVSQETSITLRFNSTVSVNDIHFVITGSQYGTYSSRAVQSNDDQILICKPLTPFQPGETVTVQLSGIVEFAFQFHVTAQRNNAFDYLAWLKKTENFSVSFNQTQKKPISRITTMNGITVSSDFPEIVIHENKATAPGRIFFGTIFNNTGNYVVIMENDGTPYFYRRYPSSNWGTGEFKLQPTGVLTFHLYTPHRYIALDQNYIEIDTLTCKNGYITDAHELLLLPNGHSLFICVDPQTIDMRGVTGGRKNATVLGNHVQELDENETVVFEWRSWDYFRIEDAIHEDLTHSEIDYVHMNSIAVDYDSNLVISSRNLSEITKINRKTKEIMWRLGGVHNQFKFDDGDVEISYQHHARPVPGKRDHYTIFDNGNHRQPHFSRAVEYKLDLTDSTAQKVWEFRYDPDRYTSMLGNVQRLSNENSFINWSESSPIWACEVTPDKEIVYEFEAFGTSSNRVRRYEWEGISLVPYLIVESYNTGVALIHNKFGDHTVDHYRIYGDTHKNAETLLTTSEGTVTYLNNLENQTTWFFRVKAVYQNGDSSDFSNEESIYASFVEPGQNMIQNGDFSDETNRWSFQESNGASANTEIDMNGQCHIQIENGGTNAWDVQLRQEDLELIYGRTYLFEFEAHTDGNRKIEAKITKSTSPFHNYGNIGSSFLGSEKQSYSYQFVMEYQNDLNGRVVFNCGQSTDDVYLDNVSFKEVTTSSIHRSISAPNTYKLYNNYPNPFNPSTEIGFELPKDEKITLKVYDLLGREAQTLVNEHRRAGRHQVAFDGSNLPSGIYLYKLQTSSFSQTHKMILMK